MHSFFIEEKKEKEKKPLKKNIMINETIPLFFTQVNIYTKEKLTLLYLKRQYLFNSCEECQIR